MTEGGAIETREGGGGPPPPFFFPPAYVHTGVVLKVEKGLVQNVLWVDALDAQIVEHHVVGEMKRTVQDICLALQQIPRVFRLNLLVHHQNHNT